MSGLLLTDEERRRFVDYCRREAASLDGITKQMALMGAPAPQQYKLRIAAYSIVAEDLDKIESVSVGKGDVG